MRGLLHLAIRLTAPVGAIRTKHPCLPVVTQTGSKHRMHAFVQLPIEKESQGGGIPPIILEITASGAMSLNTQPIPPGGLQQRLTEVYAGRPDKVMFVKADGAVPYGDVVGVLDVARGAGVEVLGAVLPTAVAGVGGGD